MQCRLGTWSYSYNQSQDRVRWSVEGILLLLSRRHVSGVRAAWSQQNRGLAANWVQKPPDIRLSVLETEPLLGIYLRDQQSLSLGIQHSTSSIYTEFSS
jgi:hypothetical protein